MTFKKSKPKPQFFQTEKMCSIDALTTQMLSIQTSLSTSAFIFMGGIKILKCKPNTFFRLLNFF
jgi:hypothetical protein